MTNAFFIITCPAVRACLVLRYLSYCVLQPELVRDRRALISLCGDDSKAFLKTSWHCTNLVERKIRLIRYFYFNIVGVVKVALISSSSHWQTYLETRLSIFSASNVLPRSSILKCHDNLERTKQGHTKSCFSGEEECHQVNSWSQWQAVILHTNGQCHPWEN